MLRASSAIHQELSDVMTDRGDWVGRSTRWPDRKEVTTIQEKPLCVLTGAIEHEAPQRRAIFASPTVSAGRTWG